MKTKNFSKTVLLALFVAIACFACDKTVFYADTQSVDEGGWPATQKLKFEINVTDTVQAYNFYFLLRHTANFEWMNAFFFMQTTFPNKEIAHDTLECVLADENGEWFGRGRGTVKDNKIMFKPCVRFPMKGRYTFEIQHGMRELNLKNIKDVGLRLENCTMK